jgi:predicted DNA-binding protein (UPF0251 family)
MARTEKLRSIEAPPMNFRFFPEVKDLQEDDPVIIPLDEFEAIRLSDQMKLGHREASEIMGISRPTFTRLLERARGHMAEFLVDGRSLAISGGSIRFSSHVFCCRHCRAPFKWNQEGEPVCPRCKESDALHAHAACRGSCLCCEKAEEDFTPPPPQADPS